MDSMLYDEDHHHPIIHDPQGVSFERIQIPCPQNGYCWTSGSAHYGFATPGFYLQADQSESHPIDDHWEISSSWFSPNNDTRDDHLFIRWNGAQENHLLNIHVYSIDGSLVLPIANHELNLQAAEWIWDGKDNNGYLCPAGVYFLLMSDQSPTSKKREIIKSIVLSP
jgi:hypothetical protein